MAWRSTRSERLWLDAPSTSDLDAFYAIHGDARTWTYLPNGRHASRTASAAKLDIMIAQWAADGLGYWTVRETATGPVVGFAGCAVPPGRSWWNLYYRFAVSAQGHGYAAEVARRAIEAAHDVEPDRPALAYLLEDNVASRRTTERLGLQQVWRGPDRDNPDPAAIRVVYVDRAPDDELMRRIAEFCEGSALRDGS
jgi:RimJ/RimL family protein N-acetyltransferase